MNKKIVIIILLFILSITLINQSTYASEIFSSGENFIKEGEGQNLPIGTGSIKDTSDQIYNILLIVGVAITVIVGAILGVQFMMGSMEDKAKIKESLIPFTIGSIVIFGAFGIWKIIASLLQSI